MEINYYGYFTPFGGYGIANLNWVENLSRYFDVYAKSKLQSGKLEKDLICEKFPQAYEALFLKKWKKCRVGIVEATPFNFHLNESEIKVASTMAETDEISGSWVKATNKMDYVIVPNFFYKRVFKKSGVSVPINVIPHGIDHKFWKYRERPERDEFTFGIAGYLDDRKGWKQVVEAFVNEFERSEPVRLKIHSTNPETMYYTRWDAKYAKIESGHGYWSFEELRDFYYSLDCFVFPSRAEGIGYPPREAMSTGIPCIIMDYSGLSDIAEPQFNYALKPSGFERAVNPVEQQTGKWAKIDIGKLMKLMRKAYSSKARTKKYGELGSRFIQQYYSWDSVTREMANFLRGL